MTNESSFKIPVEKLVSWAAANVLRATTPTAGIIQKYAQDNNTSVDNIKRMAKFYISNAQMFGDKRIEYIDVLQDLLGNINEIPGPMLTKELVRECYNELMEELGSDVSTPPSPSPSDVDLGDAASQLARTKGELKTILGRAQKLGIIRQDKDKIYILDKNKYLQIVGDMPQKIKSLQQRLEPSEEEI